MIEVLREWGWAALLELAGALALIGALTFISLAEAALVRVDAVTARQLVEAGRRHAPLLQRLVERRQEILGSLIVALDASLLGAAGCVSAFALHFGSGWVPISALIAIPLILIFGEITPKTVSLHRPEQTALACAPAVAALHRLMSPVTRGINAISQVLLRYVVTPVLGGQVGPTGLMLSEEDLKQLITIGERQGEIQRDEREMIHGVIEFADRVAREVMVPRTDVVGMSADATVADAVRVSTETGHSRIPVYERDLDHIVGIIYAKDLLALLRDGRSDAALGSVSRAPYLVPESKAVDELLREMQRQRVHMAVVIDEYGGTAGLVTIEDLLEEIVGEIVDEYDREGPGIVRVDDRTSLVDGRVHVNEIEEAFCVRLPEGDFDTIAGFVLERLGRIAKVGERVRCDDLEMVVEKVSRHRIEKVRVIHPPPPSPGDERPPSADETTDGDVDARNGRP
jgi:CBS domain containing-hemolysin-like protein